MVVGWQDSCLPYQQSIRFNRNEIEDWVMRHRVDGVAPEETLEDDNDLDDDDDDEGEAKAGTSNLVFTAHQQRWSSLPGSWSH